MLLNDAQVRNAKPRQEDYRLVDGHGLYVFVTTGGAKLWRWRYRFKGKEQVMSFGAYPGISISAAREAHEKARKVLAQGINPMIQKKEQKEEKRKDQVEIGQPTSVAPDVPTFRHVATQWYDWWKTGKDERYVGFVKKRMDADILPKLGDRLMDDITPEQVASIVVAIEERGAEDVARRALQTTHQIFRWAMSRGLTGHNPAGAFKPKDILKPMRRENFKRVDRRELPELLRRIHFYNGSPVTRLAMKLMALIFVRTNEMIEGEWSEIDFKEAQWDIPAERMKGPEGKKRPHIVPLSQQADELLEELWNYRKDNIYIFPGEQGATPQQQHDPIRAGTDGVQGENDRAWVPLDCFHPSPRAGLRRQAHRGATGACTRK